MDKFSSLETLHMYRSNFFLKVSLTTHSTKLIHKTGESFLAMCILPFKQVFLEPLFHQLLQLFKSQNSNFESINNCFRYNFYGSFFCFFLNESLQHLCCSMISRQEPNPQIEIFKSFLLKVTKFQEIIQFLTINLKKPNRNCPRC